MARYRGRLGDEEFVIQVKSVARTLEVTSLEVTARKIEPGEILDNSEITAEPTPEEQVALKKMIALLQNITAH